MIVTYDNDIDAIYFKLTENSIESTEAETDRIIIDYDKDNKIVGIEVLDFNYLVKKGLTINFTLILFKTNLYNFIYIKSQNLDFSLFNPFRYLLPNT